MEFEFDTISKRVGPTARERCRAICPNQPIRQEKI